jgi:hypothetical protein
MTGSFVSHHLIDAIEDGCESRSKLISDGFHGGRCPFHSVVPRSVVPGAGTGQYRNVRKAEDVFENVGELEIFRKGHPHIRD